jgi:hypothetical protein
MDRSYAWHNSRKEWVETTLDAAESSQEYACLFGKDSGDPADSPHGSVAARSEARTYGFAPESYFSKVGEIDLEDFLATVAPSAVRVSALAQDTLGIRVTQNSPNGAYEQEFVLDHRYGWNVISHKVFRASGRMSSERSMESLALGDVPFLVKATLREYSSGEPAELRHEVILEVETGSVEVNTPVQEEDFQIHLPAGTRLRDRRSGTEVIVEQDR